MELSNEELLEIIVSLRKRLHLLQGDAERYSIYTYELPAVKSSLDKCIKEYERRK